MNKPLQNPKKKNTAQAMVEFALALPILLLVVYGLLETGRLLFMYASVVTAARQAARYGSASGDNGAGTFYYDDCGGIQAAANRVAFIQSFTNISVSYDDGPQKSWAQTGCPISTTDHPVNGDRITVSVTTHFSPIVPLVPFQGFDINSTDSRTILVGIPIEVTPPPGGGGGGGSQLALTKQARGPNSTDPSKYYAAGDVITYTYTLQNNGTSALSGPFTVTDDKIGSFNCSSGNLATNGDTATCTGTYVITDADVTAKSVTNTATATDGSHSVVSNNASQTVTLGANPAITLAKSGVAPTTIAAGQLIQYTFIITNTGNVSLTPPYTISDALIGSNWNCPSTPNPLPVSGTVTCTGTYALKNSDISNGTVKNTATSTAKYGSQTVTSPSASATVLTPPLFLDLSVSPGSVTAVGQTVTYTYTLTNRTTSGMSNIKVTDTRGANGFSCVASLGGGATSTCTHTYTVTQADFDSPTGYFSNTASATAQGNINSNVAGVNVTVGQFPTITLTKTASPVLTGPGQFFSTGQVITYTYTVHNSGNVTITPTVAAPLKVTDSDPRVKMAATCSVTSGSIAPNTNMAPACTGTLTLEDADIDAGTVTSTGTVNAKFGSTALTATSTYTLKTFYDARVSVIKTADKTYFTGAGDVITYSYSIKNTGGVAPLQIGTAYTLSDHNLTDNTSVVVTCPNTAGKSLALGASIACNTTSYPVTAVDVTAGKVENIASIVSGSTNPVSISVGSKKVAVILLVCDATHPTSSPLSPIPDGSNTSWGILNNTGTDLHFATPSGMTITWSGGNLQQILVGGTSVWSGNQAPNGTISLSTVGWPVIPYSGNPTLTTMAFTFSPSAGTGIKVSLTFQEKAGNQCSITSP